MNLINTSYTSAQAIEKLHRSFSEAIPFKYLVLDDFLNQETADQLFFNFPPLESLNVKRKSLNEKKAEDYHFERLASCL